MRLPWGTTWPYGGHSRRAGRRASQPTESTSTPSSQIDEHDERGDDRTDGRGGRAGLEADPAQLIAGIADAADGHPADDHGEQGPAADRQGPHPPGADVLLVGCGRRRGRGGRGRRGHDGRSSWSWVVGLDAAGGPPRVEVGAGSMGVAWLGGHRRPLEALGWRSRYHAQATISERQQEPQTDRASTKPFAVGTVTGTIASTGTSMSLSGWPWVMTGTPCGSAQRLAPSTTAAVTT